MADERERRMWRQWDGFELWLQRYVNRWNPAAFLPFFKNREGWWVLIRFILLWVLTYAAALGCFAIAIPFSLYLGADVFLFNTAVVFVTERPFKLIRSNLYTMVGYASLALAFSPFWLLLHCFTSTEQNVYKAALDRTIDAVYQSVRTLTTAGPEGTLSGGAKLLASFESLLGIYFLSIIIAGYLSLSKGGRTA